MAVQVVMIAGAVAKTVAADLGIDRYYARVLPQGGDCDEPES